MNWKEFRTKREQLGMSQKDIADRIGVTHQAISKWENGMGEPDPYHEKKIN